jgi:curved DNA-binding protein CbpA
MPRELYDLLGVPGTADSEDIRRAYLLRMRVVHPDRFNRVQQPAEWLQANDMLRELNAAYEILSDPARRARYDASISQTGSGRRQGSGEAAGPKRPPAEPSGHGTSSPNEGDIERFLQLCQSIRLTCWQKIQTGPGDGAERLIVLRAAYADYERQASPWLSIILDTHRSNTPAIAQARNAAAKCLSSLAGGFMGADDFDSAETLALKALPLVFDNEKLEAEVKGQLEYIAAEKQKSGPQSGRGPREAAEPKQPAPEPSGHGPPNEGAIERFLSKSIEYIDKVVLVVGIAVFVGLLLLTMIFTHGNGRQPSAPPVSQDLPATDAEKYMRDRLSEISGPKANPTARQKALRQIGAAAKQGLTFPVTDSEMSAAMERAFPVAKKAIQEGKIHGKILPDGQIDSDDADHALQRALGDPLEADFWRLQNLNDQIEALRRANPDELVHLLNSHNPQAHTNVTDPYAVHLLNRIEKATPVEQQEIWQRLQRGGLLQRLQALEKSGQLAGLGSAPPVKPKSPAMQIPGPSGISAGPPPPKASPRDGHEWNVVSSAPLPPAPSRAPNGSPSAAMPLPTKTIDPCLASSFAWGQRPSNGHESEYDQTVRGYSKLTVVNGNSDDAALILSSSAVETPDRLVYVRAEMEATISEIPPGRYRVKFQIGKHWDSDAEIFRCPLATSMFDHEETFEEKKTETDADLSVQYSDVKLTLHKVVGGNAPTTPIDPSAFRRRRPH